MGGGKPVDECRRVPAPFIASQPNVIMEGSLSKQTNNRNWPPRFVFLTTDALYFYPTRSSDVVKGCVPISSNTDLFDMPKGPGLMSGFFFSIVGHCSKNQKKDKLLSYYDGREFYIRCETKEEKTCWMNAIGLACVGKVDSAKAYAKKLAKINTPTAEVKQISEAPKPAPVMRSAAVVNEPRLCSATVCYITEETSPPEPPVQRAAPSRPAAPLPQNRPPARVPSKSPPPPPPGGLSRSQSARSPGPSYMKKNSPGPSPQPASSSSSPSSHKPLPAPGRGGNVPGYLSRSAQSTSSLPSSSARSNKPPPPPPPTSRPGGDIASRRPPPVPQTRPGGSAVNRGPAPRKTLEQTRAQARGQHHAVPKPASSNSASPSSSYGAKNAAGFEICFVCENAIVMAKDRVLVDGKYPAHAGCFKCAACARQLDPIAHDYDIYDGLYYCLPHYGWVLEQVRKEQEKGDEPADEKDPNAPKKWKMDWTTKKWRIE